MLNIKFSRLLGIVFLLMGLGFLSLQAQTSVQAKINYMETLKNEAANLEEKGYYDQSIEKSLEVKRLADQIDVIVAVLRKWYLLQKNISVAKQIGADKIAPEEFNMAMEFYKSAEIAFSDESYDKAEENIDEGLYYIELALEKAREELANRPQSVDDPTMELEKMNNNEYVVRLIPQRRDCLWRIAEYDYVYGNPWLWKRIYEANRDIIEDPDLIYPGQKLIIPALPYEPDLR